MSGRLLGWAYKQKTGSSVTKAVLVKLVDNANDTGYAFPSMEHLTAFMELSERAVREHIKKLEDLGLLTVIREKVAEKVNLPNRYQLCIDATSELGEITVERTPMAQYAVPLPGDVHNSMAPGAGGVLHDVQREPLLLNPQENPQVEPPSTAIALVEAPSDLDSAVVIFNNEAENCPKWTRCIKVTEPRRRAILARIKESGLQGWRRAVEMAAMSAHLGGPIPTDGDHQGWRMDIEWFAKPGNFTKIRYRTLV